MHVCDGYHGVSLLPNQSQLYTLYNMLTNVCVVFSCPISIVSTVNEYLFTQGTFTLTMFSAVIFHILR